MRFSMYLFIAGCFLMTSQILFSQTTKEKIKSHTITKHKKNKKLDLDELSIDGKVISPGEMTANTNKEDFARFIIPLRQDFDDLIELDILSSY